MAIIILPKNQGELLWTNSNPSAAFAEQDIVIGDNDNIYHSVIIIFNWSTTMPAKQCVYLDSLIENAWVHYAGKTRFVEYDGLFTVHFDADDGNNTGLIPYKIIGFKEALV